MLGGSRRGAALGIVEPLPRTGTAVPTSRERAELDRGYLGGESPGNLLKLPAPEGVERRVI